jgi:hypothetical protein
MKKLLIALPLIAAGMPAAAIDVPGLLVDQCSSCHGSEVYTRKDRRVHNLFELEKQLQRCNHAVGSKWDLNTVTAVMDYLNSKYYKFKE